jgi:hypothetical protein
MNGRFAWALAVAVAASSLMGCAAKETKWSGEAAQYAAYATRIPLYPGTKFTDAMGSESWGDGPHSYSYGMTWWCETKATREELLAWYSACLPNAERSTPYDNVIQLKVIPEGAKPGEDMGVQIEDGGKYRVFENRSKKELHS